MFTQKTLKDDLQKLGLQKGDKVLIHTSLSKVGMVEGGPRGFVNVILDVVGQDGLAVFPTFTGKRDDSAANPPYFHVLESVCWTGKVPETARKHQGAVRSIHPTHSVSALGKTAEELTKDHDKVKTPCGEGSPFVKLAKSGGKILLVGVDHRSNTTFHTAEELAGCPYHMLKEPARARVVDYSGKERLVLTALHKWGTKTDFNRLETEFVKAGIQKIGKVGEAECRLIESGPMLSIAIETLEKDPYFLVV